MVDVTSNRVYGIDPDFRVVSSAEAEAKLRAGYGITYLHSYGPISDAGLSGSPGFRGNHSSFISAVRDGPFAAAKLCDPLYDGRRPGIPRGPQWIPWASLVRAGELLVVGNGETMVDRYGRDRLFVGFTRVPFRATGPIKGVKYSVSFGGAAFYTYNLRNGVIVGREATEFSKPTSASCGPPSVYPWPGEASRRLVLMTTGGLKGEYVAVPQGGAVLHEKEIV